MYSRIFLAAVVTVFFLASCQRKSEYTKMVDRELAKGVQVDSLFLGIKFGMTSKDFYSHCWELNKQHIIKDGFGNTSVLYKLNELKSPVAMLFYPTFQDNKIVEMPVIFFYEAWAPWNEQFSADNLQLDLVKLFEKWYGPGFLEEPHPSVKGDKVFIKVDGNRRIMIFKAGEQNVKALFTDLLHKQNKDSIQ